MELVKSTLSLGLALQDPLQWLELLNPLRWLDFQDPLRRLDLRDTPCGGWTFGIHYSGTSDSW